MNTAISQARFEVPTECLKLLEEIVVRFGGKIISREEDAEGCVVIPPIPERERIGVLLRGARLRAGLTQKALARAIGVPQSHISEYEKNRRPIPRAKAEELARVLKTVPTHFLPLSNT